MDANAKKRGLVFLNSQQNLGSYLITPRVVAIVVGVVLLTD